MLGEAAMAPERSQALTKANLCELSGRNFDFFNGVEWHFEPKIR
jgi:hypothetical protein